MFSFVNNTLGIAGSHAGSSVWHPSLSACLISLWLRDQKILLILTNGTEIPLVALIVRLSQQEPMLNQIN
jgi:hypothetical protein